MHLSVARCIVRIACVVLSPVAAVAGQLTVTWDDNSTNETGFLVERSVNGQSFEKIGSVGANVVTFVDSSVSSDTSYSYRVAAVRDSNQSEYSNLATIKTAPETVAPAISLQPISSQTVSAGADVTIAVLVSGTPLPTLQWKKDGKTIAGATSASLSLKAVTEADGGNYSVAATNSAGSVASSNSLLVVQTVSVSPQPAASVSPSPTVTAVPPSSSSSSAVAVAPSSNVAVNASPSVPPETPPTNAPVVASVVRASRIVNLSIRSVPGAGDRALLIGFVVGGGAKTMLLRAVGPSLATYTRESVYPDPKLSVYSGSSILATNDDWLSTAALKTAFQRVGAFPLLDNSRDAALVTSLPPKTYTANIAGEGEGVALAEIYDADTASDPTGRLMNVSARSFAGTGEGVLIIGFVISGDTPLRVLVRGLGPALNNYGLTNVISDPQLNLYSGSTLVRNNDNWGGSTEIAEAFRKTGASLLQDPQSKDAALVATLAPGAYTAVVSGVGGTTGIALAEVYEIP